MLRMPNFFRGFGRILQIPELCIDFDPGWDRIRPESYYHRNKNCEKRPVILEIIYSGLTELYVHRAAYLCFHGQVGKYVTKIFIFASFFWQKKVGLGPQYLMIRIQKIQKTQ